MPRARSKRPQAGLAEAERAAALAQIARGWLERERRERLAAVTLAQKRAKARCLAAAREHFTRSERTGEDDRDETARAIPEPAREDDRDESARAIPAPEPTSEDDRDESRCPLTGPGAGGSNGA
jgi:hypothetical protein